MTYKIAALLANISLALSLIVALVFGIVQVRIGARDRRERLTLEALRNFQTREFAEMIARLSYHKVPSNQKKNRPDLFSLPRKWNRWVCWLPNIT